MRKVIGMAALAAVAAGCMTQSKFLASSQTTAMQTAVNRGQFEMNCPQASGTIISQEMVQPALQGPWVGGLQRAEYTVGVSGCGDRKTYIVICPEGGDGCYAAGPGRFLRQ
jgi:hypothetical protein